MTLKLLYLISKQMFWILKQKLPRELLKTLTSRQKVYQKDLLDREEESLKPLLLREREKQKMARKLLMTKRRESRILMMLELRVSKMPLIFRKKLSMMKSKAFEIRKMNLTRYMGSLREIILKDLSDKNLFLTQKL